MSITFFLKKISNSDCGIVFYAECHVEDIIYSTCENFVEFSDFIDILTSGHVGF